MKYIVTLIICFLSTYTLSAQDRIVTLQGEEIIGKVMIVDTAFIHYALKDTTVKDTLLYTEELQKLKKADVFMIAYTNGTKDVFTQNLPEEKTVETAENKTSDNLGDLYQLGQRDAKQMFDGSGAFVAGFIGLIPGAVVAVTTPKVKPTKVSDPNLIGEPNYKRGYEKAAAKKKAANALGGYIAGRVATLFLIIGLAIMFE